MKKTEKDYMKEWQTLAKKYFISVRVLRHVCNSYKDKYSNLSYKDAIKIMIHEADRKMTEAKKSYRAIAIEYTKWVLKEPVSLGDSYHINIHLQKDVSMLCGFVDKIGYRNSIKHFLYRITEKDLEDIVKTEF